MSTRILNAQGILSSDVPTGNLLWVDAVNGVDALATRGRMTIPFKTLTAAKNAARSGNPVAIPPIPNDTIIVLPGYYDEKNLLKDKVNWHFLPGAVVKYSGNAEGGIFDTSTNGTNGAVESLISGCGDFQINNFVSTAHVVNSAADYSDIAIEARKMFSPQVSCVKTSNTSGKLELNIREDILSSSGTAVEIGGGAATINIIRAYRLYSSGWPGLSVNGGNVDLQAQYVGSSAAAAISIGGSTGSNIVIRAYEILSSSSYGIYYNATSNPQLTIIGARIKSNFNSSGGHSIFVAAGGSNHIKLAGCSLLSYHGFSNAFNANNTTIVQFHGLSIGQRGVTNLTPIPSAAWIPNQAIT